MKLTWRLLRHRLTCSWPNRLLEWSGRKEYYATYHWWDGGTEFYSGDCLKAWSFSQAMRIAQSRCPASKNSWQRSRWDVIRTDQLIG